MGKKVELKEAFKRLFLFHYEYNTNRTCLSGVYKLPSGKEIQTSIENPKYLVDYMEKRMSSENKDAIKAGIESFGYSIEEVLESYIDVTHMELVGYIEEHLETEYDGEFEIGEFINQYFVDLEGGVKWLEPGKNREPKWYEFDKAVGMALTDYLLLCNKLPS